MSLEIDEINYKDLINNKEYLQYQDIKIGLLFIPNDIKYFERHNYHATITIFDEDIKNYLKRKMLISYENDNPITRSEKVFFKDDFGELEYRGSKYKSINNLTIENIDNIPLYSFSKYSFDNVSIINTREISECAFYCSNVNSLLIDNNIQIVGFNSLPSNLKIIDGYFDIKNNSKLILAKLDDVIKPKISNETKIIYQGVASNAKNIEELVIPYGVTMIGSHAFNNCQKIRSILLPNTLKYIDFLAFDKTRADDVFYDGTLDEWNKVVIIDEDYSYMEWLGRPVQLDTSPLKSNNNFYVLDKNGKKKFNGNRYKKVN